MLYIILVPAAVIVVLIPLIVFKVSSSREKALCADLFEQEKQKKHAEALRTVRKLIGLRPKFAAYHADLARILEKAGQPAAALDAYRQMLDSEIFSFTFGKEKIAENIIRLQFGLKRFSDAFKTAWKLWKYKPDNVWALIGLGRVYAGQGRLEEAKKHLLEAVQASPDNPDARFFLALCLLDSGDSRNSVAHLEKAFELNPADRNIIFFLASLYLSIGRNDRAAQLLAKIGVSAESVPQKIVQVGILAKDMPRLDLEYLKDLGREMKKSGRVTSVDQLQGLSGDELHEVVLKMIQKLKLVVKEELKGVFDTSAEQRFLCEDTDGVLVFVAFVKTKSELGPIPLTEIQNQMEAKGAVKSILLLTSELSASAMRYAEKDASLIVIDRSKIGKYL
jgi:tetratricopeptide (TPR) repeat protein